MHGAYQKRKGQASLIIAKRECVKRRFSPSPSVLPRMLERKVMARLRSPCFLSGGVGSAVRMYMAMWQAMAIACMHGVQDKS